MIIQESKCYSCGGQIEAGVHKKRVCTHCGKPIITRQTLKDPVTVRIRRSKGMINKLGRCLLYFKDGTVVRLNGGREYEYQTSDVVNKVIIKPKNNFLDAIFLDRINSVVTFVIEENAKEIELEIEWVEMSTWTAKGSGLSDVYVYKLDRKETKRVNKRIKGAGKPK